MLRVFAIAALFCSFWSATLAYFPSFAERCDDSCADDRDGQCPPGCPDCNCCLARTPVPMPSAAALVLPCPEQVRLPAMVTEVPELVDPPELLRPPISSPA